MYKTITNPLTGNIYVLDKQIGGGKCSLCGSPNTSKATCPLNPKSKKNATNTRKHPLAADDEEPVVAVTEPVAAELELTEDAIRELITTLETERTGLRTRQLELEEIIKF
jgi:hypothetical protein